MSAPSALHIPTVGAIGNMTLAVIMRATPGHTGRKMTASGMSGTASLAILIAALIRPFAELLPEHYQLILMLSGGSWIVAFGLFSVEYGRMLIMPRA